MSKYTTEVRFICEQKAGLSESEGFTRVDDVLNQSWNKIFTSDVAFFDDAYKPILCKKILKHYYTREICAETVGLWQLWLNTRLEEIMPYYNELYKSAQLEFKPFDDVNYTRESNRKNTENENSTKTENENSTKTGTNNRTVSSDSSGSSNTDTIDKYSDTPQGSITNLSDDTYLTNARITSDENSFTNENSGTDNQTINETNDRDKSGNEDYFEKIMGKQGNKNYSEMLLDFRKTFLNIDMQVIEEFSDLFFGLW